MVDLVCHPQTPCDAVRRIHAQVTRASQGALAVTYSIDGDVERLRIPSPRTPARAEGLWQHTCCELFVARPGAAAYHEFNFSPSGEWAAYDFRAYRDGGSLSVPDPKIHVRIFPGELRLEAAVGGETGKLLLGLSAVIEDRDGALSYWALRHPAGKPDFHLREAFALSLA